MFVTLILFFNIFILRHLAMVLGNCLDWLLVNLILNIQVFYFDRIDGGLFDNFLIAREKVEPSKAKGEPVAPKPMSKPIDFDTQSTNGSMIISTTSPRMNDDSSFIRLPPMFTLSPPSTSQ